jgi:hypothetical protein
MAQISLYIDKTANALVGGLNTSTNVDPNSLLLSYPDTVSMRIYLFDRIQTQLGPSAFPFEIIPTAGMTLLLEMTDGVVGSGRTIFAAQYTWGTDSNDQYFFADLSLATAAILALLMASEPDAAPVWLKIAYIQNGKQTDVYNRQVPINIGVGTAVATVPSPLTPASVEGSNASYYPQAPVPGVPLYITTPLGKIIWLRPVDNLDGSASFAPTPVN